MLKFGTDLKGESIYDYSVAKSFQPSRDLHFEVDKQPKVSGQQIVLTARLSNHGGREETLIVFPIHNSNPFHADLIKSEQLSPKALSSTGPSLPPSVPPPPMKILLPPNSTAVFTTAIDLARWQYAATPRAQIQWTFHYWNEPKPRGTLGLQLPAPIK